MAKDKRNYNVFLNLHTVSGIIITVGLYVCFFAGGIALFYKNINNWEHNKVTIIQTDQSSIDYEKALKVIEKEGYILENRTIDFTVKEINNKNYLSVKSIKKQSKKGKNQKTADLNKDLVSFNPKGDFELELNLDNYSKRENLNHTKKVKRQGKHKGNVSKIGTYIYHLHYFNQLPVIGIYLSGFVALFFLIALITGVIVHWKKIFKNFFTFRLKSSIKILWTDSHTALGVIGLPFQFIFAITGSLLGFVMIFMILNITVLYDGNKDDFIATVVPAFKSYKSSGEPLERRVNINQLATTTPQKLHINKEGYQLTAKINNYKDENSTFVMMYRGIKEKMFYENAHIVYKLGNGEILDKTAVDQQGFNLSTVIETVRKLHFGSYGGYLLKLIYFLLSLLTCYVILSGVMIWIVARDNKKYESKRTFHTNVGAIFIGICMGLYPAIAYLFCLTKILPAQMNARFSSIENSFLLFWLAYTVYAYYIKNLHTITKQALVLGGTLGILVPICNGLHSDLWFWKSLDTNHIDSFFVDLIWLFTGVITLIIGLNTKKLISKKSK